VSLGWAALAGAAASLAVAAASSALVAWTGPLDKPRARSSHVHPTVTSAGLAVMAGAAVGLLVFAHLAPFPLIGLAPTALALGFAGGLGLLGAFDDLVDIGAKGKLLAQAVVGLLFAAMIARIEALPIGGGFRLPLGPVIGALGTTLWLVVATNATNFMDGVDGLAAGSIALVLATLAAAGFVEGETAVAGAALAGAAALVGFLPWNLPARRLFQGDAGALFSGFLAASLAVTASGRVSLYLVPTALTPFLTDVLLTLTVRARRGESLWEAHRDHLYQLWLHKTGKPHVALTLRVWAIMAAYCAYGLACEAAPEGLRPPLFALGVAVAAVLWRQARRGLEAEPAPAAGG
jgi:UDP-N-acetylmuramyl pentapeptide phosphotransferase/UDP-N-acetylglucosamine-1-phosphate transferase